jgi:hypothetical protein
MDLSKSLRNNAKLRGKLKPVFKAFHGVYLYRLECHIFGAWFVRNIKKGWGIDDLRFYLEEHQAKERLRYADRGIAITKYEQDRLDQLMNLDADTIWDCHTVYTSQKSRIENKIFSTYFKTEAEVVDFLVKWPRIADGLRHIFAPTNDEVAEQLKDNVVFQRKPTHKYKIDVREGQYEKSSKQALSEYLKNFPDDFHIPAGLQKRLDNYNTTFMYGHFYANNLETLTFVKLISTDFVRKIYRVEQL